MVRGQPRQIIHGTPISKITKAKWTRGVAVVVENLLCKHEALSSNFSPPEKKYTLFCIVYKIYNILFKSGKINRKKLYISS
jgi:hypothetical protein